MKYITIILALIMALCNNPNVNEKNNMPCDTYIAEILIEQQMIENQRDSLWDEWYILEKRVKKLTRSPKETEEAANSTSDTTR